MIRQLLTKLVGIKYLVLLLGVLPVLLISIGLVSYFTASHLNELENSHTFRGQAFAKELAASSVYGLFTGDKNILIQNAKIYLSRPNIVAVRIADKENHTLVDIGTDELKEQDLLKQGRVFSAPVIGFQASADPMDLAPGDHEQMNKGQDILGYVHILLSNDHLLKHQNHHLIVALVLILIGVAVTAMIALVMSQHLVNPIMRLTSAVNELKDGKLDERVPAKSRGELGMLELGFNKMAQRLAISRDELFQEVEQATQDFRLTMDALEERNIELHLARKESDKANRTKSEFLANISHEIRTPLSGISGFTDLLLKTDLDQTQREYLNTIINSTENLNTIINDLLDLSKMEQGKLDLLNSPFEIRTLVDDVVTLFTTKSSEKGVELISMVYHDLPDLLIGDRLRIQQILGNLLSNAIKFTPQGDVVLRIMRYDEETAEHSETNSFNILCSVKDSGIGINSTVQKKLFTPFTQAESSTDRIYGGTGLGLSICKRLVSAMGGEIGVNSIEGEGSEFWFTLPLQSSSVPTMRDQLHGLKALVYDPHPTSRNATVGRLEYLGLRCRVLDHQMVTNNHFPRIEKGDIILISIPANKRSAKAIYLEKQHVIRIIREHYQQPVIVQIPLHDPQNLTISDSEGEYCGSCHSKPIATEALFRSICRELSLPQADNFFGGNSENEDLSTSSIKGFRILVTDDSPINLRLASLILTSNGAEVVEASSGSEAIHHINQQDFDLILMDVHMPGMSGLEATRRIREQEPDDRRIPIFALTADGISDNHQNIIEAGVDEILLKPLKEEILLSVIHKLKPQWKKTITQDRAAPIAVPEESLLHLLAKELDGMKQEIQSNIDTQDFLNLWQALHKLHGAALSSGADSLANVAVQMEEQINAEDLKSIKALMKKMDNEIDHIKSMNP